MPTTGLWVLTAAYLAERGTCCHAGCRQPLRDRGLQPGRGSGRTVSSLRFQTEGDCVSDTSQGAGWWLASDGMWYPPEVWTGPPRQSDATSQTAPATPSMATGYPAWPAGYPATPGYQGYPGPAGFGGPPPNNGLAIAALVCSCVGVVPFFFGLPCILGVIFGFVSRSQIRNSQGRQQGAGLALAGIIVGFSLIALFILGIVLIAVFAHTTTNCPGSDQICTVN